ncbi:MAG: DNA recombination protein RmuC [Chlorobi bacterium]|nr:DNA recombination protein RmuC [Chlorobiota bacterium]
MEIIYLITGLIAGTIITWFLTRNKFKKQLETLNSQVAEKENTLLKSESTQESLQGKIDFYLNQINELKEELTREREKTNELTEKIARGETELKNLQEKLKTHKEEVEKLQDKFSLEFKNLANEILEEKTKKFTEQNRNNLDIILKPFEKKIDEFKVKVEQTYEKGLKDQTGLKVEIQKLYVLNKEISEEANNLTKALKGDVKKQGNWGEVILERILENSGLIKGQEYETQVSFINDEGRRIQPDVIVYLPDSKHIIIDSKVSLVAYEKYINSDDNDEKQKFIKAHLLSIKTHIQELSQKHYQNIKQLNTPDYVLLFIPIEASFSVAVQEDQALFNYAWDNHIVIVSPSTLIATLMTISSIWKQENQTKNALEIARQSGALYDKFVGLIHDLNDIGKKLGGVQKSYDDAMNKLSSGKGNLVGKIEAIKKLGAKAQKSMPQNVSNKIEE